jgi:hypothetical protein
MAIGWDYRCRECGHEWLLFSTRLSIGPVQWGATEWTCFSCQTFLSVAAEVDANSWSVWRRSHDAEIEQNSHLVKLADIIEARLAKVGRLTPIELKFAAIECPTCSDAMSTAPFGDCAMKCPNCHKYAGENSHPDELRIYG